MIINMEAIKAPETILKYVWQKIVLARRDESIIVPRLIDHKFDFSYQSKPKT